MLFAVTCNAFCGNVQCFLRQCAMLFAAILTDICNALLKGIAYSIGNAYSLFITCYRYEKLSEPGRVQIKRFD